MVKAPGLGYSKSTGYTTNRYAIQFIKALGEYITAYMYHILNP